MAGGWAGSGTMAGMARTPAAEAGHDRPTSTEDLGEDVVALTVAARDRGRASVLRTVDGVLVRIVVELA